MLRVWGAKGDPLGQEGEAKNRPSSDVKSGGHYRNFFLRFDPQGEPVLYLWKASLKHVKNRGPLSPISGFDFQFCSVECLVP